MNAPALCLFALATACAATSNPSRSKLEPLQHTPEPKVKSEDPKAAPSAPAPASTNAPSSTNASAAANDPKPAQEAPAKAPQLDLALGRVGDLPIGGREFLHKLWMEDNALARRVLEKLIFARLAQLEADRFGIRLSEDDVDQAVARAIVTLEKKLEEKGSKLTLDQHVERNLELDPKLYRTDLREEAIAQMLAERCVRAWMVESERCRIRLTDIRNSEALAKAKDDLAAGKSFDEMALAHGFGEDEATHTTRMTIARAESQELSRVVFATPIGVIGGPMEQSGRWLYFVVDERLPGKEGNWTALREPVEKSLRDEPVSNLEFLQWRSAMVRRYQVELQPFFDLVERKGGS